MSWAKLDDRFHSNAKILSLSHDAFRLYVCSITYCRGEESGGFLAHSAAKALVRMQGVRAKAIDELQAARLWLVIGAGYQINDYEEYGPSKEESSADRQKRWSEAGKKGAAARWAHSDGNAIAKQSQSDRNDPVPVPVPVTSNEVTIVQPFEMEAQELCRRLADNMVANGCKRPNWGAAWISEARRLYSLDHRDPAESLALVDWAMQDAFWKPNILSIPKFRQKYDQLKLAAQRSSSASGIKKHQEHTQYLANVEELGRRMEEEYATN